MWTIEVNCDKWQLIKACNSKTQGFVTWNTCWKRTETKITQRLRQNENHRSWNYVSFSTIYLHTISGLCANKCLFWDLVIFKPFGCPEQRPASSQYHTEHGEKKEKNCLRIWEPTLWKSMDNLKATSPSPEILMFLCPLWATSSRGLQPMAL